MSKKNTKNNKSKKRKKVSKELKIYKRLMCVIVLILGTHHANENLYFGLTGIALATYTILSD